MSLTGRNSLARCQEPRCHRTPFRCFPSGVLSLRPWPKLECLRGLAITDNQHPRDGMTTFVRQLLPVIFLCHSCQAAVYTSISLPSEAIKANLSPSGQEPKTKFIPLRGNLILVTICLKVLAETLHNMPACHPGPWLAGWLGS